MTMTTPPAAATLWINPKRLGASGRTATIAAPGFRFRYSSAISSAGVFERTTFATSLSASRTSACWASSMASSKTVGLDIVAYMISANEAELPAWSAIRKGHFRMAGAGLQHRLLRLVRARRLTAAAHRTEQEQLNVVRIVQLVVGRQPRRLVRRHRT